MWQGWEKSGQSLRWAEETGLSQRGLRFAAEVRKQLADVAGPQGQNLMEKRDAPPPKLWHSGRSLMYCHRELYLDYV